jgi:hypothetical protein
MLSSPTEKLNEWVEKHSMSFDARGLLHATPKDADGRCWHVPEEWVSIEKGRSLGSSRRAKHMLELMRLSQSCASLCQRSKWLGWGG